MDYVMWWIFIACVAGTIGRIRDIGFLGYFILGLLLGPFAVLIALATKGKPAMVTPGQPAVADRNIVLRAENVTIPKGTAVIVGEIRVHEGAHVTQVVFNDATYTVHTEYLRPID